MVSCIKIETASLIFAILSLLTTFLGSLMYCVFIVRLYSGLVNLIIQDEKKLHVNIEIWLTTYGLHMNIIMTIMLSILLIGLVFSIVLLKGLLSKKSHLVKAYFVYGVTGNTIAVLFGIYFTTAIIVKIGLLILLGCILYGFILAMIKKTYLKLQIIEHNKRIQKDVVEEKSISIKL